MKLTSDTESSTLTVTDNTNTENSEISETDESVELAEPLNDNYVKWAIPESSNPDAETQNKINEILDEKYELGVTFIPLSDGLDETSYHDELKNTDADIAFLGFDSDDDKPCEELIASDFFEPIDDMLEDSELKNAIPSQLWKSAENNGHIYTIPNESMQNIGVSVVFDLDKIPEDTAKSFSGDITELDEILGDNGMLLYNQSDFDFSSYYECYYSNGIVVTPDGTAEGVAENEDCMTWLREINSLYLDGKATDIECDWSVLITRDTAQIDKENIYAFKTKDILGARFSASTGILKTSDKKQEAFNLLEIIHTDSEIANLLVYGDGYTEKDGCALDSNGEMIYGYMNKLTFGLNSNVLFGSDMLMQLDSVEEMQAYYDENVTVSPLIGVDISADCSEINKIMNRYRNIWKSKDIKKDISNMQTELDSADIEEITRKITEQLKNNLS